MKPPRQRLNHPGDTQSSRLIVLDANNQPRLSVSWKNNAQPVEAQGWRHGLALGDRPMGTAEERAGRMEATGSVGPGQPRTEKLRNTIRVSP